MLSESLLIKIILFLYFKIYFYINILMTVYLLNKNELFYFSK